MCRREDLNLHPLRDAILSRARIPIPPLRQIEKYTSYFSFKFAVMAVHRVVDTLDKYKVVYIYPTPANLCSVYQNFEKMLE